MKILVCGPKARYDMYRPSFAEDLPVELVFTDPHRSALQTAREHPDVQVIFADAITPVGRTQLDNRRRDWAAFRDGVEELMKEETQDG